MDPNQLPISRNRLGFYYYPDTLHYSEHDLQIWLPELHQLDISWLTLVAPIERAIPEYFLRGLLAAGIQPVLHFRPSIDAPFEEEELRLYFRSYARWGASYVTLFDQPNSRSAWSSSSWMQADLVERFLDRFLPLAEIALQEGLVPVFPPLEPGGDYWDLAFLRSSLNSLQRRSGQRLLDSLVLGATAFTGDRPLEWGSGGPDRWPGAQPYLTPTGEQDHLGFRIFDWYLAIAQQETGKRMPMILSKVGYLLKSTAGVEDADIDQATHAKRNLAIVNLMAGSSNDPNAPNSLPEEILACHFWLLSAEDGSSQQTQAWFRPGGRHLPVVEEMRVWTALRQKYPDSFDLATRHDESGESQSMTTGSGTANEKQHIVDHYLLLPLYAWGVAEWDINLLEPLLQKYRPAVGFSLEEAIHAAHVTVVGGEWAFSEQALEALRSAGCKVERIVVDGTLVAT